MPQIVKANAEQAAQFSARNSFGDSLQLADFLRGAGEGDDNGLIIAGFTFYRYDKSTAEEIKAFEDAEREALADPTNAVKVALYNDLKAKREENLSKPYICAEFGDRFAGLSISVKSLIASYVDTNNVAHFGNGEVNNIVRKIALENRTKSDGEVIGLLTAAVAGKSLVCSIETFRAKSKRTGNEYDSHVFHFSFKK